MEGSFIVTIEKQTKQVNQGGVYIIPSNVPHSIIASTSKARVMAMLTCGKQRTRSETTLNFTMPGDVIAP